MTEPAPADPDRRVTTVRVTVKLFAQLKRAAGASDVTVELRHGATARDAAHAVTERFPAVDVHGAMVAVNASYAKPSTVLNDGDVVALLPPVSGG